MAAPKLTAEQQHALRQWFAAEYGGPLIKKWFADREWPSLSDATLSYYREKWAGEISAARQERRASAINSGLALKEERVKRLTEHADELEAIKWVPDEKGRLWNEKAWRETLADIASELGHRKQTTEITGKDGAPIAFSWGATVAELATGSAAGADPPGDDSGA